jgi:hypothetical protein
MSLFFSFFSFPRLTVTSSLYVTLFVCNSYVVEQIPGYVAGGDTTDVLEKGYWSSYNGKVLTRSFCMH